MFDNGSLVDIVGSENVIDDNETLKVYAKDESFAKPIMPRCVVKLTSGGGPRENYSEEARKIIAWANDTLTPLVPISSGAPHFRGDSIPSAPGSVMVDCSQMKKVVEIDRKNKVVVVEPGVTFGELALEIERQDLRINTPLLPRRSKSVIGSILEREPGTMPKYQLDSGYPLCCVEGIFGGGYRFKTSATVGLSSAKEQWEMSGGQPMANAIWWTNPVRLIQGSQGTMGIVTKAMLKCEILPRLQKPFLVGSSDINSMIALSHSLIKTRLVNECFILNDVNLAAILAKNPEEFGILKGALPAWVIFYSIAGYNYYPEEKIGYQEKHMMRLASDTGLEPVDGLGEISASELMELLQKPSNEQYWKMKPKGSCQDIFFLTLTDKITGFVDLVQNMAENHDYAAADVGIYLQPIMQGGAWHCEFNIFYDPKDTDESSLVRQLFDDTSRSLLAQAAFFSRPYGLWAELAYQRDKESAKMLKKVKEILDPNNVMNPGKLVFSDVATREDK